MDTPIPVEQDHPVKKAGLKQGILATLPLLPGVAAFGLLYGMMARQAGLTPAETVLMSLLVHAGSSQFAAVGMWAAYQWAAIVLTTLVINLRHLLMGASIAPYVRGLTTPWKALVAVWMSDESYALSIAEYQKGSGTQQFFLGANLGIYLIWPLSGLAGALIGRAIPNPAQFGLDLIFPLAFLGLLSTLVRNWKDLLAAIAAGGVALLGAVWLPGKWYVIAAGLAGSLVGLALEEGERKWKTS